MKKISAEIVADSVNPCGNRITTMLLTYPRFIHGELLTHRMFSRNSASSRAIPFEKMVKMVEEYPFIPIAWQKDHKGMQGSEYFTERISVDNTDMFDLKTVWLDLRDEAIKKATRLNRMGLTKQLCNRLLEPFMWHTVLVTATEWNNFFELRCPRYNYLFDFYKSKKDVLKASKDGKYNDGRNFSDFTTEDWLGINSSQAEIHIQALAEAMWDAYNESQPVLLNPGKWHIPFGDRFDENNSPMKLWVGDNTINKLKVSVARCARLSYNTFDGEINYEKDIELFDRLLNSGHMSPFEHCARAMNEEEYFCHHKGMVEGEFDYHSEVGSFFRILEEPKFMNDKRNGWCNNFRGFTQYRYIIENNIPL